MIPEMAFERLLGLDECWAVVAAEYETEPVERFFLVLRETDQLWPKLRCPVATCAHPEVVCHDHTEGPANGPWRRARDLRCAGWTWWSRTLNPLLRRRGLASGATAT